MDLIEENRNFFAKIKHLIVWVQKNGYPDPVKRKALRYYLDGIGVL